MHPDIHIDSVREVFDDGNHNAFTDLIRFRGRFYLAFRCNPTGHLAFEGSAAVVLASDDGDAWNEVLRFTVPDRDLRDPHLAILGDRLFVLSGAWLLEENLTLNNQRGFGASTTDGENWDGPYTLDGSDGRYIWRAVTHGGRIYANANCMLEVPPGSDRTVEELANRATLLVSDDGMKFSPFLTFPQEGGNETGFLFEDDGSLLTVMRTVGPPPHSAVVWRAKPPYEEWSHTLLHRFIGGPMLAKWGGRYLVGGRRFDGDQASGVIGSNTSIGWLEGLGSGETPHLVDVVDLPSGGDTSYTGFVPLSDTTGLLSYYSSHEGSGTRDAPAAVYVARISIDA